MLHFHFALFIARCCWVQDFREASARSRLKAIHAPQNVHPTPRLCPYIAFLYNETTGMSERLLVLLGWLPRQQTACG
jgi:hypothetical protein